MAIPLDKRSLSDALEAFEERLTERLEERFERMLEKRHKESHERLRDELVERIHERLKASLPDPDEEGEDEDEDEPEVPLEEHIDKWTKLVTTHPVTQHLAGELQARGGIGALLDRLFGPKPPAVGS